MKRQKRIPTSRRLPVILSALALVATSVIFAQEPRRASAEEENKVAAALARALESSDYAKKRQDAGLVDVADADFAGFKLKRSDEEWRRLLTPNQFQVSRRKAAEPSAVAWKVTEQPGIYRCLCEQPLFRSDAALASESTLAHFHEAIEGAVVTDLSSEWSHDHIEVELRCSMCGAHLGHVDPGESAEDPLIFQVKPTALVLDVAELEK